MRTVITYGTFDLFHIGHVNLLRRLKSLGDRLVVGLSTDEFNTIKGKSAIFPYFQRYEIIKSIRYVDAVFPEHDWDQKRDDIIRESANIFAMGDDWFGKFDHLSDIVEVVYLPRTGDISTTEIKQAVRLLNAEHLIRINRAVENLHEMVGDLISSNHHVVK